MKALTLKFGLDRHDEYVLVISPQGRMLLVYRPDTQGHIAPEGRFLARRIEILSACMIVT